jgi:hypothetical protein
MHRPPNSGKGGISYEGRRKDRKMRASTLQMHSIDGWRIL